MNLRDRLVKWKHKLLGEFLPPGKFPEEYKNIQALLLASRKHDKCTLYLPANRHGDIALDATIHIPEDVNRASRMLAESIGMLSTSFGFDCHDTLLIVSDSDELLDKISKYSAIVTLTQVRGNECRLKKVRRCYR